MKTKKRGVYAALAVMLLITAALVTSCPDALNLGSLPAMQTGNPNGSQPPEGKSYVRLNFGSSDGRTIMPSTSMNAQSFASFKVFMKSTDNADEPEDGTTTYTYATLTAKDFTVTSGKTYNVTVNAYMTAYTGSGDVIAASGTKSTGAISGATTSVPITLVEKWDGSSTGTFTWTLTYAGGNFSSLTTATMDIRQLGGTAVGSQIDLKSNASGSNATIASGEYRVVVTLNGGANLQEDVQTFILHVYNAMTSSWSNNFSALNNIAYVVTFTNTDGSGNTNTATANYTHGQLLNAAGPYPYAMPPVHGTDPGDYTFAGWYTSDGSGSNWAGLTPVNPAAYRIFKTQSLYARWNDISSPPEANVSVTFTLEDTGDTLALSGTPSISQASLLGGTALSLTVTGAPANSTFSWKFKGVEVEDSNTFVIEFDANDSDTYEYVVVGSHAISVEVTTDEPRTYSKNFNLTVTGS